MTGTVCGAVCLNAVGMYKAAQLTEVYRLLAETYGIRSEALLAGVTDRSLLKKMPTLAEVADATIFTASDRASALTGAIVNVTGGMIVE